jgi:hypothetical protein
MDERELFKYYLKTTVILKTAVVYLPVMYFTVYLDAFFTKMILNVNSFVSILSLFSFPWWKLLIIAIIQYSVCCFFWGLFVGLKRVITRNKDFFLS